MEKAKRYLEVYESVKEDIIKGRYPVGTKLPSKRVMAEAKGMSLVTIEHAYELLAEEGYIFTKCFSKSCTHWHYMYSCIF